MKIIDDFTVKDTHHTGLTVVEICKRLNIDRRRKPFIWNNDLVCNIKFTNHCTGCDGSGCRECGYTGKRVGCYPELLASNYTIERELTPTLINKTK